MTIATLVPPRLQQKYVWREWSHATSILHGDFSSEWNDLLDCLDTFILKQSAILKPGGGRSEIPQAIDGFLRSRGWSERSFDIELVVDGARRHMPTHKIDNFKNRVGVEVEWNNKTEFYDRDLNNFRLLHQLGVISVGVIITRLTELQLLFNRLGKGASYGASTTHWNKLIPRIEGGGAGGCPLLVIGMGMSCYDPNS